jgi:serine/threonine protein kinase/tetratricopeptide (TPR) repeat protein
VDTYELTKVEETGSSADPMMERLRLATAQRMLRDLPREIGRYRVVGKIGEGGMGTVFRAHDPKLDRPVAIKLLKPQGFEAQGVAEQARMLREARALAAVSHPNVVEVFEVGQHHGSMFLAMEYLDAVEVREWIDYDEPRWQQVVEAFIAAGRGLAAAHDRGLVHRDFKPSNVLMGRDGRVRVVDFGLAKGLYELTPTPSDPSQPSIDSTASATSNEALALNLTRTGALIGTPAYMAPEQLRGTRADAAADQFAFCVSIWEGLFGNRPFLGKNPKAVLRAIERGAPKAPRSPRVPAAIVKAVRRGLSENPAHRWPTMAELLDTLEASARRSRRVPLMVGALGVTAVVAFAGWPRSETSEHCGPSGPSLPAWSDVDRDALRQHYAAAGMEASWSRVESGLDAYAAELHAAWARACAAEAAPSDLAADAQRSCLRERTVAADAVAELLARTDVPMPGQLMASLGPVSACLDASDHGPRPPTAHAAALAAVRRDITRAGILQKAGRQQDALELLGDAMSRTRALGWDPLLARALVMRAGVLVAMGRHEESRRDLEMAFAAARRAGDDEAAMVASAKLAHVLGVEMNRMDEGLTWARHSEAAARRLGRSDPDEHLHTTLGFIYVYAGESERALEHLEAAAGVLLQDQARLPPREQLESHRLLGGVLLHLGRPAQARTHFEAALRLAEDNYGSRTHDVAALAFNLGLAVDAEGKDLHRAHREFARAASIYAEHLPPDHPDLGDALFHAGLTLAHQGRYEEAEPDMRKGLAVLADSLGRDDRFVIQSRLELAETLVAAGKLDAAQDVALSAHAGAEAALGAEHPLYGRACRILGDIALERGDLVEARRHFEESLAGTAGTEPRARDLRLETTLSLAELHMRAGRLEDAAALADDAEQLTLVLHGASSPRTAEVTLRTLTIRLAAGSVSPSEARQAEAALDMLVDSSADPAFTATKGLEVARALVAIEDREQGLRIAKRARDLMTVRTAEDVQSGLDELIGRLGG